MMMEFSELRFDTPNNVCQSLRILAEHARQGEIFVIAVDMDETSGGPYRQTVKLAIVEPHKIAR